MTRKVKQRRKKKQNNPASHPLPHEDTNKMKRW